MTSTTTFYYSRIIGTKVRDENHLYLGRLKDFVIDLNQKRVDESEPIRPKVTALFIKSKGHFTFSDLTVKKFKKQFIITCIGACEVPEDIAKNNFLLGESILDQQIVDINGRKVVRVNDIRMAAIKDGVFAIAVDIGVEGLLRRIGIVKPIKRLFNLVGISLPSKFILFDDVAAVDYTNLNIKLSMSSSKLHTLHPSDLADIIEDLGKASKTSVFSTLNEEVAADVLEELETHEQIHIIENLSIEKAADVLEKMPANEAADIIDELEDDKAEMLLQEMETETSDEVRELLEYPDKTVGSLMTTEVLSFGENTTIEEALNEIRLQQPETEMLYNLFVIDKNEKLIATLSLRDLVISQPQTKIKDVMKKNPISVFDEDKIDSLAEIISKYNLLAIPVTDYDNKLEGMVVIDDVIEDLVGKRRTV
jgi:CBS domain-containing protein/sporulation protein YlmC with PRC-barrel domain